MSKIYGPSYSLAILKYQWCFFEKNTLTFSPVTRHEPLPRHAGDAQPAGGLRLLAPLCGCKLNWPQKGSKFTKILLP
jgi:hypothetical protein